MFIKLKYHTEIMISFYDREHHFRSKILKYKGKQDFEKDQIPKVIVNYLARRYPYVSREIFLNALKNKENIEFAIKVKRIDDNGNVSYCEMRDSNGVLERVANFCGENYKIIENYFDGFTTIEIDFEFSDNIMFEKEESVSPMLFN